MEAPVGDPLPYEDEDKPKPDAAPPAAEPPSYRDADKASREVPRPQVERADWLVGAEDGIAAETARAAQQPEVLREAPRLVKPTDPDAGRPRPNSQFMISPVPSRPGGVAPPPAAVKPALPSWDPGHSSVPTLRHAPVPGEARPSSPIPELTRDFPMDDAEERARVSARLAEQQAHEAAVAARPHEVVAPQEFDIPTLPVPWWAQVPQLMRTDRRIQLALLSVVLVIAVMAFWPRAEKTVSIGHLKQHAERYADTEVRVGGRVSEVFAVGGSWAYTLVQGRDTIVVFSRTRRPEPRTNIVVIGTLSNGYLDGQSRAAIFEATR
jgi:hypothetical protein